MNTFGGLKPGRHDALNFDLLLKEAKPGQKQVDVDPPLPKSYADLKVVPSSVGNLMTRFHHFRRLYPKFGPFWDSLLNDVDAREVRSSARFESIFHFSVIFISKLLHENSLPNSHVSKLLHPPQLPQIVFTLDNFRATKGRDMTSEELEECMQWFLELGLRGTKRCEKKGRKSGSERSSSEEEMLSAQKAKAQALSLQFLYDLQSKQIMEVGGHCRQKAQKTAKSVRKLLYIVVEKELDRRKKKVQSSREPDSEANPSGSSDSEASNEQILNSLKVSFESDVNMVEEAIDFSALVGEVTEDDCDTDRDIYMTDGDDSDLEYSDDTCCNTPGDIDCSFELFMRFCIPVDIAYLFSRTFTEFFRQKLEEMLNPPPSLLEDARESPHAPGTPMGNSSDRLLTKLYDLLVAKTTENIPGDDFSWVISALGCYAASTLRLELEEDHKMAGVTERNVAEWTRPLDEKAHTPAMAEAFLQSRLLESVNKIRKQMSLPLLPELEKSRMATSVFTNQVQGFDVWSNFNRDHLWTRKSSLQTTLPPKPEPIVRGNGFGNLPAPRASPRMDYSCPQPDMVDSTHHTPRKAENPPSFSLNQPGQGGQDGLRYDEEGRPRLPPTQAKEANDLLRAVLGSPSDWDPQTGAYIGGAKKPGNTDESQFKVTSTSEYSLPQDALKFARESVDRPSPMNVQPPSSGAGKNTPHKGGKGDNKGKGDKGPSPRNINDDISPQSYRNHTPSKGGKDGKGKDGKDGFKGKDGKSPKGKDKDGKGKDDKGKGKDAKKGKGKDGKDDKGKGKKGKDGKDKGKDGKDKERERSRSRSKSRDQKEAELAHEEIKRMYESQIDFSNPDAFWESFEKADGEPIVVAKKEEEVQEKPKEKKQEEKPATAPAPAAKSAAPSMSKAGSIKTTTVGKAAGISTTMGKAAGISVSKSAPKPDPALVDSEGSDLNESLEFPEDNLEYLEPPAPVESEGEVPVETATATGTVTEVEQEPVPALVPEPVVEKVVEEVKVEEPVAEEPAPPILPLSPNPNDIDDAEMRMLLGLEPVPDVLEEEVKPVEPPQLDQLNDPLLLSDCESIVTPMSVSSNPLKPIPGTPSSLFGAKKGNCTPGGDSKQGKKQGSFDGKGQNTRGNPVKPSGKTARIPIANASVAPRSVNSGGTGPALPPPRDWSKIQFHKKKEEPPQSQAPVLPLPAVGRDNFNPLIEFGRERDFHRQEQSRSFGSSSGGKQGGFEIGKDGFKGKAKGNRDGQGKGNRDGNKGNRDGKNQGKEGKGKGRNGRDRRQQQKGVPQRGPDFNPYQQLNPQGPFKGKGSPVENSWGTADSPPGLSADFGGMGVYDTPPENGGYHQQKPIGDNPFV